MMTTRSRRDAGARGRTSPGSTSLRMWLGGAAVAVLVVAGATLPSFNDDT